MMRRRAFQAFTLIEMIVVLAITSVLLAIIIFPLVQSVNMTRAAENFSEEQQRARLLLDQITTDIANGTAVGDNEGQNGDTIVLMPQEPYQSGLNGHVQVHLYNARVDIYQEAQNGQVTTDSSGNPVYINPGNGRADPTLHSPRGQEMVPAATGGTIVRYFVGLRDPLNYYFNPFDGLLMPKGTGQDNLFVLYRAEFQPYIPDPTVTTGNHPGMRPNTTLFRTDPNDSTAVYLNDPYFFFYDPQSSSGAQKTRVQNWLKISTIVSSPSRIDLIRALTIRSVVGGNVTDEVDANAGVPKVVPLIQFRPMPMSEEAANPATVNTLGTETNQWSSTTNPELGIAADVFRTSKGDWSSTVVKITPYNANPPAAPIPQDNLLADFRSLSEHQTSEGIDGTAEEVLNYTDTSSSSPTPQQIPVFNLTSYAQAASSGTAYPFMAGIMGAGSGGWLTTLTQTFRNEVIPFNFDPHSGQLDTSFNIAEVGNPADSTIQADNAPEVYTCGIDTDHTPNPPAGGTGLGTAYPPTTDPNVSTATGVHFYSQKYASVNEQYNEAYTEFPALRSILHRFINLQVTPEFGGSVSPDFDSGVTAGFASPMDPMDSLELPPGSAPRTPWASGWTGFGTYLSPAGASSNTRGAYSDIWESSVTIVPGSEVVIGPDQTNPTGTYPSNLIRYTRVTQNPGLNQYSINYTNLQPPTDYSVFFPAGTDFTQPNVQAAVVSLIQPRYQVGYVEFDSDPNVPLPPGRIEVSYRFQLNRPADLIAIDYDSRQQMDVLLTLNSYAPGGVVQAPQSVTLESTAVIRNYLR